MFRSEGTTTHTSCTGSRRKLQALLRVEITLLRVEIKGKNSTISTRAYSKVEIVENFYKYPEVILPYVRVFSGKNSTFLQFLPKKPWIIWTLRATPCGLPVENEMILLCITLPNLYCSLVSNNAHHQQY